MLRVQHKLESLAELSISVRWVQHKFENLPEIYILAFLGSKINEQKVGIRAPGPHGEIRAGTLRRIPVSMSQMVGWRPIWWQKGVIWGPLGFRARPAHPGPRARCPSPPALLQTGRDHPPRHSDGGALIMESTWLGLAWTGQA